MRRPNICNNAVGTVDDAYKPQNLPPPKDEGRLSLVRRVLGGNRKKDGHSSSFRNRQFGVALSDLQVNNNSVPKVLHRMCVYLELNGLKTEELFKPSAGNSSTVETLKNQFNNTGDAELELANDVYSVALLLIVWLKELPEPLLSQETAVELISLMHKYDGDSWWGPVCYESILTSGLISSNVMGSVLRLLHSYTSKYPTTMTYIPNVFCSLLTREDLQDISSVDAVELTSKLISDYGLIFKKRNLDMDSLNNTNCSTIVVPECKLSLKQRKRKEKIDYSLKSERKFVRSNSEERPALNGSCGSVRANTMRRVSSHEDFSKSRSNGIPKCELPLKKITQPLHERNACSPQRSRRLPTVGMIDSLPEPSPAAGYASHLYDENEHERRRNNERFAPQPQGGRRTAPRRRRIKHRFSYSQSKENELEQRMDLKIHSHIKEKRDSGNVETAAVPPPAPPSLPFAVEPESQVQEEIKDVEKKSGAVAADDDETLTEEEDDRSSSPISGVGSPILDLNSLKGEIKDDPIPSVPWSGVQPSDERLVSPYNSMFVGHRAFTAIHRPFEDEPSLLDLGTQINNLKRKLKKYDEGFEREFGYPPSHADKLANPDTKKMSSMLSKLKKQLKNTKEECMKLAKCEKKQLREDIVVEVEKRLSEKRVHAGRPESLEEMTHQQLVDEKTAMQKVLLQIEASFGRPTSNEEKILVRGLYERYRTVKRMILRHAPSKFKESVSELGTILEHEAMDFTTSPPSTPPRQFSPQTSVADSLSYNEATVSSSDSPSSSLYQLRVTDIPLDNLHSLPRNELIILQKSARDEKRRLRRVLKEREMDFQIKTGRRLQKEDRPSSFDSIYVEYKHAKAKLKFIDALMLKKK